MTNNFTVENITHLRAAPLEGSGGWRISFASDNTGMYHQMYANGELVAHSDTIEQRDFLLDSEVCPCQIVITAVDEALRSIDISEYLPEAIKKPDWVYEALFVRSIKHPTGSKVALMGDHATGQFDSAPLYQREIWPRWAVRWGWGEDPFGRGGSGFDGTGAPGLGKGAFGAGLFGMNTDVMIIAVPLKEQGTHQLKLRTISQDNQQEEISLDSVTIWPPPQPPSSLEITAYDSETGTLTLQIT